MALTLMRGIMRNDVCVLMYHKSANRTLVQREIYSCTLIEALLYLNFVFLFAVFSSIPVLVTTQHFETSLTFSPHDNGQQDQWKDKIFQAGTQTTVIIADRFLAFLCLTK